MAQEAVAVEFFLTGAALTHPTEKYLQTRDTAVSGSELEAAVAAMVVLEEMARPALYTLNGTEANTTHKNDLNVRMVNLNTIRF